MTDQNVITLAQAFEAIHLFMERFSRDGFECWDNNNLHIFRWQTDKEILWKYRLYHKDGYCIDIQKEVLPDDCIGAGEERYKWNGNVWKNGRGIPNNYPQNLLHLLQAWGIHTRLLMNNIHNN